MNPPDAILQLSVEDDNIVISKESLKDLIFMTLQKGHSLPKAVDVLRMKHLAEHAVLSIEKTYFDFVKAEPQ
jgi:hypothetical protein